MNAEKKAQKKERVTMVTKWSNHTLWEGHQPQRMEEAREEFLLEASDSSALP